MLHRFGLLTLDFYLVLVAASCVASQNIRIQVNNENLQNPPYVLEALKQASAHESAEQARLKGNSNIANEQTTTSGLSGNRLPQASMPKANQEFGRRDSEDAAAASNMDKKSSAITEETIEELLDLAPESVLRLSPEGIIGPLSSQDNSHSAVASGRIENDLGQSQLSTNHEARKPQLPVTSSHLKRPAITVDQLEDQLRSSSDNLATFESRTNLTSEFATGGAKSRVSPSVMADDGPAAIDMDKKKAIGNVQPPDSWEASQKMPGVTNSSLVPATVRRQYGHQTRTRVTLGGGYERDKLPPQVDLLSSDSHNNAPETPMTPLERPASQHLGQDPVESSNVDSSSDYEQSGIVENSRIVEVPKRIVLPMSVVSLDEQATKASPVNVTRRRDSRCPANGATSLEHPTACDKYFLCQDGQISEHTCPNGLMYGTRDVVRDYCVHRWEAVCGDKTIPNPISSPGCRWQNGIFSVQGSPKCVPDFYECKDGKFEVRKCPIGGQVYDDKTKSCRYAEQVGCTQEALADFRCPADDQANTYWPFPRYFLNDRALIHCINDKPQIIRCRDHERVDPEHLFCVPIKKSEFASGDESSAGTPEITGRRSNSAHQEREKAAKPAASLPTTVVTAN